MAAAIIIILFIIGIYYTGHQKDLYKNHPNWLVRHSKLLVLLTITIIPIVLVNVILLKPYYKDEASFLNDQLKNQRYLSKIDAYERLFQLYPDSLPLRIDYLDFINEFTVDKDYLHTFHFSDNKQVNRQSREYLYALLLSSEHAYNYVDTRYLDTITKSNDRFQHFILGRGYEMLYHYEQAKIHYYQEIENNPAFQKTYLRLLGLHSLDENELKDFVLDKRYYPHLPLRLQRHYFYTYGKVLPYLWVITQDVFDDINLFAFIAALVISVLWLIFLRAMDIFNREKWRDIIIVFLGGALFTNLCLPVYDFFHETMDFYLNGEALHDFIYSSLVIGGAEELVKLLPWLIFGWLTRKLKEPYDYILYASTAALGFAFVENLMYLEEPGNTVARCLMSTTSHMFDASVVAYSFILMRYKVRQTNWRFLLPIAGFILACLSHGFYDFWLISPATRDLKIITVLFMILTIHIWFFFKNNAINNSQFYRKEPFNSGNLLDILLIGIMTVLMVEFVLIGIHYGSVNANSKMISDALIIFPFLAYMTVILRNIQIVPGKWSAYSIPLIGHVKKRFSLSGNAQPASPGNCLGESLRLFVRKSNEFVSHLFPVEGICIQKISVDNDPEWYLFKLDSKLGYSGYNENHLVLRPLSKDESLLIDKVEIILLFIPDGLGLSDLNLNSADLRYTGRAFSRPNYSG